MIDADIVELARRPDGTIDEAMIVRIQQSRARRAALAHASEVLGEAVVPVFVQFNQLVARATAALRELAEAMEDDDA